jgi:hypothetical protein
MRNAASLAPVAFAVLGSVAIVYVDNVAFGGEASPIVVVLLLLASAATGAAVWGPRGWTVATITWLSVPGAHLIKHLLGLPDTLHPNTYLSILYLALFTLAVSSAGVAIGAAIARRRR